MPQQPVKSIPFLRDLINSGVGFVGHRVVERLAAAGIHVFVLDNLSVGVPKACAVENYLPVQGAIRSADTVDGVFRRARPEAAVHLAAIHHIPICERQRSYALDVKFTDTEVMLKNAAERHGVEWDVPVSSGGVYDLRDSPLREDESALRGSDNYSVCKLKNEQQVQFWNERAGQTVRIARIFNTIGYGDPNGRLIPDILAQIPLPTKTAMIRVGNTQPKRDYIYVDDTADDLVALLRDRRRDVRFDTFNICFGIEYSVLEIINEIVYLLNFDTSTEVDPVCKCKVDHLHQWGSPIKAQEVLKWCAKYDLRSSLNDIIGHYCDWLLMAIATTPKLLTEGRATYNCGFERGT